MRQLAFFISSFFLIFLFISCSNPIEGIEVLTCKEFDNKLQDAKQQQLIDVRTPEEYSAGTINSAINIDFYSEDFKKNINTLDKKSAVFVFCAKGGRSNSASKILKEEGFKVIYDLEGGYNAWVLYKK
ncbi:MAG: rhodanese-like domain-containing protein [Saprospiraceae bacterium]|nr:rhodanese-like domain-containing protein [Saprospiraceae bacterium]